MAQVKEVRAARLSTLANFHGSGALVGQSRRSGPLPNFARLAMQGAPDNPPGLKPGKASPPKGPRRHHGRARPATVLKNTGWAGARVRSRVR
eukprot:1915993-Alexandrium_andersonii.AAC.1